MKNSNVVKNEREIIIIPSDYVEFNVMRININQSGNSAFVVWNSIQEQKPNSDYRYAVQIYSKDKYTPGAQPVQIASGNKAFSYEGADSGDVYDILTYTPAITANPDLNDYTYTWQAYAGDWEIANGEGSIRVNP